MPSVLDQFQPSADSRSGEGRIFFLFLKRYRAVTTPTSWGDLARDFPLRHQQAFHPAARSRLQWRRFHRAARLGDRAARMEATAGRDVRRVGQGVAEANIGNAE